MAGKPLGPNLKLLLLAGIFLAVFFVPFADPVISNAINEAFMMLGDYAREHVILCLVPAFFIAGAIMIFLNQQAVIKYLGPKANKLVAYTVASVSGAILAVCSCTVLPLFKGIYKKGAGIGPATSFLYSGPAINILAIILTAKVLGWQLGLARTVGAVVFAFVIGLLMHLIFHKDDEKRVTDAAMFEAGISAGEKPLYKTTLVVAALIGILIFANWAQSKDALAWWDAIASVKFIIAGVFLAALAIMLILWYKKDELKSWGIATRDFSIQILPLLFGGVLVAGFLLGRPGHQAIIPNEWVVSLVGGNSVFSNFFAAIAGAFMYFATLTEIPIMQGLLGSGMGQGPALALLLAGPSLSLPSMLVLGGELGVKKTVVYVSLVVGLSTIAGIGYGMIV
ncbi:MAG: permease [Spirochaetaceae bacterium]|nr:MAG: permease [Spirochaetaceae bacterium]